MHGSIQREDASCRTFRRSCSRHMRSVLPLVKKNNSVVIEGEHHSSLASSTVTTTTSGYFLKGDRKISVGDCALFKPTQDSPPYIGLIRLLRYSEENILHLGVNWLYRPAEIKLGKGTLVEGAPNEIFYSFHEDEIPAASLLHPCKVAFLPRGVELPPGTSSFVCRRLYDIANKCLWWLTDQDYINDRQGEIDQLLCKTRLDMHAPLQSGGRSPKQVNGPTSTSQIKSASDSGHNSGFSSNSLMKGKKRERADHGSEQVKREHCPRSYDNDSIQCKAENNLKSEIARITEKGGLVDLEGVEKLVQLMQLEKTERKMDLVSRSMIAGVMAATDKPDCLDRFVQLRGLPVMDEWLQDIHKGKIGESNSLKESNVSVDEFLTVLLRALDKLPVDLQALQMCNIGRSVNHLRSHKNSEIQRKARSLVDTWKKRVEAEMITNETKSGSKQAVSVWPSKTRATEASHSSGRTPTGSDVAMKSSITQSSTSKTASIRSSHVDNNIKSTTLSPGHVKPASSPSTVKESFISVPTECPGDVPLVREDRSSSSNQSHNQSQSSGKEEAKSGVAGLALVNKISISSTRNRKAGGVTGTPATGVAKETSIGRSSSMNKNATVEKLNRSSSNVERALDVNEGSSHKLIVKIPNRVHSPAPDGHGVPQEDSSYTTNRVSSPVVLDNHESHDGTSEEKTDIHTCNVTMDSWQNNDPKDVLSGSVEASVSPIALPGEGRSMTADSKRSSLKSGKMHPSSFSPMSALMSCVKYSEANLSSSLDDDVGMNLLASVAAGEMSRSELLSPTDSAERITPVTKEICPSGEAKSKSPSDNNVTMGQIQFSNDDGGYYKKQAMVDGTPRLQGGLTTADDAPNEFLGEKTLDSSHSPEDMINAGSNKHSESSNTDARCKVAPMEEISEKCNQNADAASLIFPASEKLRDDEFVEDSYKNKVSQSNGRGEDITDIKAVGVSEGKASLDPMHLDNYRKIIEDSASHPFNEVGSKKGATEDLWQTASDEKPVCGANNENHTGERGEKVDGACDSLPDSMTEEDSNAVGETHRSSSSCFASDDVKNHDKGVSVENKKVGDHVSVPENVRLYSAKHDMVSKAKLRGSSPANTRSNEGEKGPSASAFAWPSEMDVKIEFDLNEGFNADEGKYGEPVSLISSGTTSVHMLNSLAFSVNPIPSGHSASITVAAAAKGPFVPPDDLLRSKRELGWRGSAATSAFRPAEPRKVLETSLVSTSMSGPDVSASKQGRVTLDFDLNVPDERVLEEMTSSEAFASGHTKFLNEPSISVPDRAFGGLDLDLNRVDDACDTGNCSTSGHHKGVISAVHLKPFDGLLGADTRRDLDLNNGPGVEDRIGDQFSIHHQIKAGLSPQISTAGLRMNGPGQGSFSSWFAPGNSYSTIALPSLLPDRGEHPYPVFPPSATQRTFGPSGVTSFTPEIYRGSVLSSSPAVPFPSNSYQFPPFPFGPTYPLPPAAFPVGTTSYVDSSSGPRLYGPPVHSQLLGPVGSVAPQFQRPYMIALPDSSNNGSLESNRRWSRQGFDLNAGPGAMESEVREEMLPVVSSAQAMTEDQARMYSVSGGMMKRKEPEGGWDSKSFRFKQSSWQ